MTDLSTSPTLTLPAFASHAGESLTLMAPADWHPRIAALADRLVFGPNYSRGVVESLGDMSRTVRHGYSTVAYDYLLTAERIAERTAR